MWLFKNKNYKRCKFCGWIVGHTPECRMYQNCNHEWARFYDVYSNDKVNKITVYICRKCLSIRVFDRQDTKAGTMLKGRII
jgi:hypothetical protein